jgi:hypothetical protein
MEINDSDRSLTRRQEKNLLKAANAVARSEFANPQREGCPDSETLSLLARRRRSLAESADLIDHIGTCSPCFIEYSRSRAAYKRRIRISYALASAAAVVILSLVIARSLHMPGGHPSPTLKEIARSPVQGDRVTELVLDLRMKGVSRSDTPDRQGNEIPPRLPRTRLSLSIQLPIGSEDGIYDVALISPAGKSMLETRGEAKLHNFVEVLPLDVDLADLAQGMYQLRLRRLQTQWISFSILLE